MILNLESKYMVLNLVRGVARWAVHVCLYIVPTKFSMGSRKSAIYKNYLYVLTGPP
jgi:hypothetical protein